MSSAHRPTWAPAVGKETRINTAQYSSRDIAGHTKLKFRQPGQNHTSDVVRRDLKLELQIAEREAARKKRKAAGLPVLEEDEVEAMGGKQPGMIEGAQGEAEDDERAKRRKVVEEALLADKDDSDDESGGGDTPKANAGKGKGKAMDVDGDDDDSDDSDDSDDDEDETAELLRELEKIKRERAEEKERLERERANASAVDRDEEIAVGNPLLNLKAALGQPTYSNGNASPSPSLSSTTAGFAVKRRWDDDVIFKNQARDINEVPKKEFVNDLLRTEFHKRFLKKFIA